MQYVHSQLLPALKPGQPIVIDNASYHTVVTDETRSPTTATKKQAMIDWLEKKSKRSVLFV